MLHLPPLRKNVPNKRAGSRRVLALAQAGDFDALGEEFPQIFIEHYFQLRRIRRDFASSGTAAEDEQTRASREKGMRIIDAGAKRVELMTSDALWAILDLLKEELADSEDDRGFYHNRTCLVDRFRDGKLYMLTVVERFDSQDKGDVRRHQLANTYLALPCFCALDRQGEIDMIWTHRPYRKHGFAKCFLDHFYPGDTPRHVAHAIPESLAFWRHMGFDHGGGGGKKRALSDDEDTR